MKKNNQRAIQHSSHYVGATVFVKENILASFDARMKLVDAKSKLDEAITEIMALPQGWRYGEGEVPNASTIKKLKTWFYLIQKRFPGIDFGLFPVADGSINLTIYHEDLSFELTFSPDDEVSFAAEKGLGSQFEIIDEVDNTTIPHVLGVLKKNVIWNLSESYTLETTTIRSNALKVRAFKTHLTEVEYPSLIKNVRSNRAATYVRISGLTTVPKLESRQYSGLSPSKALTRNFQILSI